MLSLVQTNVAPGSRTAEMPDSWLVLYNVNVPDSVAWGQWYAAQWGIPNEQLLGLDASSEEHLADTATAQAQVFSPVAAFLAAHPDIASRIMGFVVGYRVPGHYGTAGYGIGGYSITCGLQDMTDTVYSVNPDGPHRWGKILPPLGRLTKATITLDHYLAARLDGIDLATTKAMTTRAKGIWSARQVMPAHYVYYDYTDDMGTWSQLRSAVTNPLLATLPWAAFDDDTGQTPEDAFRIGWHDVENWNDARLRGSPPGPRILAYNLNSWGATTIRSTTGDGGRYVPNAIDAGYAAAIGATGEPMSTFGPYPDTLLAGLNLGWTLGECFYLANPYDDFMWELVGDPLLRVPDWCWPPPKSRADFDDDGDVDLADFLAFNMCYHGPNVPVTGTCTSRDLDGDTDVDLLDFALFKACFNGPNLRPPPSCQI